MDACLVTLHSGLCALINAYSYYLRRQKLSMFYKDNNVVVQTDAFIRHVSISNCCSSCVLFRTFWYHMTKLCLFICLFAKRYALLSSFLIYIFMYSIICTGNITPTGIISDSLFEFSKVVIELSVVAQSNNTESFNKYCDYGNKFFLPPHNSIPPWPTKMACVLYTKCKYPWIKNPLSSNNHWAFWR